MEYFFDTDPGVGNGFPISIPIPADSITHLATISTAGLSSGNHVLFVRTKSATGEWSLYEPREFFIKQPMIAAEYFFDADPGIGNGTSLPVTPGADSTMIINSVSTTGLSSGTHVLFIRTKDESQHWSLYQPREFFIKQPMIAAEYFFDADPGIDNGTSLPVTPGADSTMITNSVSTTGLSSGTHVLFIRTKDESQHWSMYEPREFFIKQPMIAAEYFFDADPGIGNGTSLPVTPGADSTMITNSVSTTGLSSGTHVLFIRTKDESQHWSMYEPREFFIKQPMIAAEYFFDADPGIGNGTAVPVSAGVDSTLITSTISTTGLQQGHHILFIRTQDESHQWSLYEPREFYIRQSIVAAEYFIDTDPGVGNAIPLIVGLPEDSITFNATIATGLLSYGTHYVFVRTKDVNGIWSLYEPQQFDVVDPLPVQWLSFDAKAIDDNALLQWITASENNCLRYDVERMIPSDSGNNQFQKVGEIPGNGTTSLQHEYHFTDYKVPCDDICYYRIKQIDFNGTIYYSKTESVRFNNTKPILKLYPNPTTANFTLDIFGFINETVLLIIYNETGQLVLQYKPTDFPFQFGSDLKPGTYFLNASTNSEPQTFKILKTK